MSSSKTAKAGEKPVKQEKRQDRNEGLYVSRPLSENAGAKVLANSPAEPEKITIIITGRAFTIDEYAARLFASRRKPKQVH